MPGESARWTPYRLATFAAAALYLELAIIRFTAAEVLYLGHFSNFVLISAFVGLGLGFLASREGPAFDLGRHVPFVLLFLFAVVLVSKFDVDILMNRFGLFFFGNVRGRTGIPGALLLVVLLLVTVSLFAGIGQGIARAFRQLAPLRAYSYDIGGSLVGIMLFTYHSARAHEPVVWVLTGSLLLAAGHLLGRDAECRSRATGVVLAGICVSVLLLSSRVGLPTIWSTYQKLQVRPDAAGRLTQVYANGIFHQVMSAVKPEDPKAPSAPWFYHVPYDWHLAGGGRLDEVLIVGAGSGTDVAVALSHGAAHIDAVEIDGGIFAIGRSFHPNRPYDDPRVTTHVADGRQFLRQTSKKYDLILFALPDSLIRISSMASVRLESYLFTLESLASVKERLKPGGTFSMYNQYRWDWLISRNATMLETAFGRPAKQVSEHQTTVFAVGPGIVGQSLPPVGFEGLPTDDWPFVYLQRPQIHWLYLGMIATFLAVALIGVGILAPAGTLRRPDGPFFFMGAAFLLLETKSIAFFSLLFGTTWVVNSLAFAGVLVSVLLANLTVQVFPMRYRNVLFVALWVALAIAYLTPAATLLGIESQLLRYVAAVLLVFSPIFIANLIFSREFRDVEESTRAFGWNMLGAVVGGGLEYLSLVVGYRNLLWIVAACYLAVAILLRRGTRSVTTSAATEAA